MEQIGFEALVVLADLVDKGAVRDRKVVVYNAFGRFDILVNSSANAVRVRFEVLEGFTENVWVRNLGLNLQATF